MHELDVEYAALLSGRPVPMALAADAGIWPVAEEGRRTTDGTEQVRRARRNGAGGEVK